MVGTHDITRQTNRRFDSSQNHIYFRYVITSFYITYVPHLHIMFRSFFSLLIIIITMESYFLYIIWMWPFSFPSPAFLLTILYLTLPFVTKIKFKLKALHNLTTAYFFFQLNFLPLSCLPTISRHIFAWQMLYLSRLSSNNTSPDTTSGLLGKNLQPTHILVHYLA